ncbi:MAG: DUF2846 domain-containing protein [Candidatus Anaerobiospirillum merdipullorum]|uniref:DUF2846 domain-containing protein n=1 Tax=Candidatus Anaerobiospirillum merdipullorum TaxID=2838450 RepID=A0A9E2KNF1_9GAMM|nr:DUF2846 domain-containing protein [Candidatus Anaerobiospirillum merdipullorum]
MMQQIKRYALLGGSALALAILAGCSASVPTVDGTAEAQAAKQFVAPTEGKAGVYVYRRDDLMGYGLYKDIYIDGICLG